MEVHQALLTWFVDVRESLKGRLSRTMLKLKANELYDEWVRENPTPESERLKFRNQWIKMWEEEEYGIYKFTEARQEILHKERGSN